MVAVGDASEGGHRLTLRTGAHEDELVVLHVVRLLEVDDGAFGDVQVAEVSGDGHVAHHRAADEDDLAPVLVGDVDDLLDAVHVRGEAGDDDLAARLRERLVERGSDGGLRLDEAWHLGVGGVHHQQIHALLADLAEFHQIGDLVVERQLVELDVAGVNQGAGGRLDVHGERVGDRVGDGDEFEVERADLELVASLDLHHGGMLVVLLAFRLNEGEGQLGADQRDVRAQLEQVGHAADMVLMAMSEHERVDLVETVLDVAEIGKNQVDARLLLFGEEHAAVDEQQVTVVFDYVHVAADFAQTAERRDAHRTLAVLRRGDQDVVLLGSGGLALERAGVAGVAIRGSAAARRATGTGPAGIVLLLLFLCHSLLVFCFFVSVCVTETTLSATARPCPSRPFASATGTAVPGVGRCRNPGASRARPVWPGQSSPAAFMPSSALAS